MEVCIYVYPNMRKSHKKWCIVKFNAMEFLINYIKNDKSYNILQISH